MKIAIKNSIVFDGEKILSGKSILIDNDTIVGIVDGKEIPYSFSIIDYNGKMIAPAFIDLQINGGDGVLFNDSPTVNSLLKIAKAHMKHGTVFMMPTITSCDKETIITAIDTVRAVKKIHTGILGLHLEGPYISTNKAGIHNRKFIRDCSIKELKEILSNNADIVKMITVAPEACSYECTQFLVDNGIKVFIGHSNATYLETIECFARGAIGVTHLFNAMSQISSREPGIVGASFSSNTWASVIADGFHVDYTNINIASRIKKNKLFLISDAMPPAGFGDMDFDIGENSICCRNNQCLSNNGIIAGSALTMDCALRNIVNNCNIDTIEALKMTSVYQAQLLNDSKLGSISPGNKATFVVLTDNLNVFQIWENGMPLFD